jgi:hypothetical protein
MDRRQINPLQSLDVHCHDPLPQIRWSSASLSTWLKRWGVFTSPPHQIYLRKCDFMQVSVYSGDIFISALSFLWLCVILFQLRLCALTEVVKTACNGEFVAGRQLACFQLVNSSTKIYENRQFVHWIFTNNFYFISFQYNPFIRNSNCFRMSKKYFTFNIALNLLNDE